MLAPDGLVWHITSSLDGYVSDVAGSIDFALRYAGPNPLAQEVMDGVGAILMGRGTYESGPAEGEVYGGKVRVPTFVVTRQSPPPGHDINFGFLDGRDLAGAVTRARAAAQGKMVVIIGPALASACLAAGFVDLVVIHVVPVLLGAGTRLYSGETKHLETLSVTQSGEVVNLVLRPKGPDQLQ